MSASHNLSKVIISATQQEAMEDKSEAQSSLGLSSLTGAAVTDQMVLDYLGNEIFDSTGYDPKTYHAETGLTLFESKLPALVVPKLVQHAVNVTADDIEQIKKILGEPLSRKPNNLARLRELLCTPTTVKDHYGRLFENRTVYQIALGAREYNVTSENGVQVVNGLVEMLGEYFKKLPDGESLRQQQYNEQFPEGSEEKEEEKIANYSRELNRMIEVVKSSSDADCQQTMALDSFHGYNLCPSYLASNDNEVLASAIYLQEEKEGLSCRFRGLDGHVKTEVISWDNLKDIPRSADDIIKTKHTYLPTILQQLAESGQFYTAEQIQQLKELSHATVTAASKEAFDAAWDQLQKYMKNIVGESVNVDVLKTLYQFRNYLEPKGVYTTGYHSNPQLLLEAYQLYDNNFASFGGNWFSPKNVLCAQKIVGLCQRGLSACELQLHAQGLYSVLEDGNKSKRTFSFTHGGGSILPLDSDPCFRLGYNYVAAVNWFGVGGAGLRRGVARAHFRDIFGEYYIKQKHQRGKDYVATWQAIELGLRDDVKLRNNS